MHRCEIIARTIKRDVIRTGIQRRGSGYGPVTALGDGIIFGQRHIIGGDGQITDDVGGVSGGNVSGRPRIQHQRIGSANDLADRDTAGAGRRITIQGARTDQRHSAARHVNCIV